MRSSPRSARGMPSNDGTSSSRTPPASSLDAAGRAGCTSAARSGTSLPSTAAVAALSVSSAAPWCVIAVRGLERPSHAKLTPSGPQYAEYDLTLAGRLGLTARATYVSRNTWSPANAFSFLWARHERTRRHFQPLARLVRRPRGPRLGWITGRSASCAKRRGGLRRATVFRRCGERSTRLRKTDSWLRVPSDAGRYADPLFPVAKGVAGTSAGPCGTLPRVSAAQRVAPPSATGE